jgi:hypothetical protein
MTTFPPREEGRGATKYHHSPAHESGLSLKCQMGAYRGWEGRMCWDGGVVGVGHRASVAASGGSSERQMTSERPSASTWRERRVEIESQLPGGRGCRHGREIVADVSCVGTDIPARDRRWREGRDSCWVRNCRGSVSGASGCSRR